MLNPEFPSGFSRFAITLFQPGKQSNGEHLAELGRRYAYQRRRISSSNSWRSYAPSSSPVSYPTSSIDPGAVADVLGRQWSASQPGAAITAEEGLITVDAHRLTMNGPEFADTARRLRIAGPSP